MTDARDEQHAIDLAYLTTPIRRRKKWDHVLVPGRVGESLAVAERLAAVKAKQPPHLRTAEVVVDELAEREARWQRTVPRHLAGVMLDPHIDMAVAKIAARWLDEDKQTLILQGRSQMGKTVAAAAVARAWWDRGRPVVWASVVDAVDSFKPEQPADAQRLRHALQTVAAPGMVVLDDLGTESATEFGQRTLLRLVDRLVTAGVRLVVTTNLGARERMDPEVLDPRLRNRIEGDGSGRSYAGFIVVDGPIRTGERLPQPRRDGPCPHGCVHGFLYAGMPYVDRRAPSVDYTVYDEALATAEGAPDEQAQVNYIEEAIAKHEDYVAERRAAYMNSVFTCPNCHPSRLQQPAGDDDAEALTWALAAEQDDAAPEEQGDLGL